MGIGDWVKSVFGATKETAGEAADKAQEVAGDAVDMAGNAAGAVAEKAGDAKDAAVDMAEAAIHEALALRRLGAAHAGNEDWRQLFLARFDV